MRLFAVLVATLVAVTLQLRVHYFFGVSPDFALAGLIAIAGIVAFWELAVAVLVSVLVLNWQPAVSQELIWFALIPIFCSLLLRLVPLTPWAANIITVALGLTLFYFLADPNFVVLDPIGSAKLLFVALAFGIALFHVFRVSFPDSRHVL